MIKSCTLYYTVDYDSAAQPQGGESDGRKWFVGPAVTRASHNWGPNQDTHTRTHPEYTWLGANIFYLKLFFLYFRCAQPKRA